MSPKNEVGEVNKLKNKSENELKYSIEYTEPEVTDTNKEVNKEAEILKRRLKKY